MKEKEEEILMRNQAARYLASLYGPPPQGGPCACMGMSCSQKNCFAYWQLFLHWERASLALEITKKLLCDPDNIFIGEKK